MQCWAHLTRSRDQYPPTRSLLPHSSVPDTPSLLPSCRALTMRPHALMLAVVLLGNLMLPLASAQNGKDTDAHPSSAQHGTVSGWGKVTRAVWGRNVSKEDLGERRTALSPPLRAREFLFFFFPLLSFSVQGQPFELVGVPDWRFTHFEAGATCECLSYTGLDKKRIK